MIKWRKIIPLIGFIYASRNHRNSPKNILNKTPECHTALVNNHMAQRARILYGTKLSAMRRNGWSWCTLLPQCRTTCSSFPDKACKAAASAGCNHGILSAVPWPLLLSHDLLWPLLTSLASTPLQTLYKIPPIQTLNHTLIYTHNNPLNYTHFLNLKPWYSPGFSNFQSSHL